MQRAAPQPQFRAPKCRKRSAPGPQFRAPKCPKKCAHFLVCGRPTPKKRGPFSGPHFNYHKQGRAQFLDRKTVIVFSRPAHHRPRSTRHPSSIFELLPGSPSCASCPPIAAPVQCLAEAVLHVDAAISVAISGHSGGWRYAPPRCVASQQLPAA